MSDSPPPIPPEFGQYNSHKTDPVYQLRFTIAWASVAVLFVLISLPNFIRSVWTRRVRDAFVGVRRNENVYEPVDGGKEILLSPGRRLEVWKGYRVVYLLKAGTMLTVSILGLDIGQLVLILAYYVTVLLCITIKAELIDNPNRPGFIAVAQLVPVFLLASKNSPLAILLSSGYERLNVLHRWCSRGAILAATTHGFLWVLDHYKNGLPIVGKRKAVTGLVTFGLFCVLGLTSLRPMRERFYQLFLAIHLLMVPAFAIAIRYHTHHAAAYLYPALAIWGLDLLLRLFRLRIRNATLLAPDTQMTIIRVHDCASGWSAGQHVRLRVFVGCRMFESHPLTIMNASQATTCLDEIGVDNELLLGARVSGDWSRALNSYAHRNVHLSPGAEEDVELAKSLNPEVTFEIGDEEDEDHETINLTDTTHSRSTTTTDPLLPETFNWSLADGGTPVRVVLGGPYGGCAFDVGTFDSVLLIAGGSGVTFTLGILDDLVGRCLRLGRRHGEVTRRIEFIWCIRSFGAVRWVAPFLSAIASRAAGAADSDSTLDLHITIYVTRSSSSKVGDAPYIPNCGLILERPRIQEVVDGFAFHREVSDDETPDYDRTSGSMGSSLAVCAAGPESLTYEVKNATARLALRNPSWLVDCHTEVYSI